ncbi:Hypothetical protein FKW44_019564 [Caligus rogercresseyi]|uniref:Uncharacterized protein n=1 Tax=Caligus rogercresseyi TaxID=217165 RepID=A0A7T8GWK2_CALRO|nr:Hypothetical protein FKW44_019564 [Caligus rogercresseyi]
MTSKGIFRLSFLASLLGRSLILKLFLHSSSLDHPPQVFPSPSNRSIKKPVNEKKIVSGLLRRNEELSLTKMKLSCYKVKCLKLSS